MVTSRPNSPLRSRCSRTSSTFSDREDAGLDLNDKTKILVKGISEAEAHTAAQRLLTADPSLAHLGPLLAPKAFVDDGYIGLGVPIGTDAFVSTL